MAKKLSYADALKVLGKNDSELLDFAEKLTDGGLGALGVPSLFGLRELLVEKGRTALEGIGAKLRGESRMSRTERIEAAHRIVVFTSFLQAWQEQAENEGPLVLSGHPDSPNMSEDESQIALLAEIDFEVHRMPFPSVLDAAHLAEVARDITLELSQHRVFVDFLSLPSVLPVFEARYTENLLRLAAEVPEFAMWVHAGEHERTREAIETGLQSLNSALEGISSGRAVDSRRQELSAVYRSTLDRNVIRSDDLPEGIRLPSLRESYIPPRGQVVTVNSTDQEPSSETWWHQQPHPQDLQGFFAAHLVHPHATGHPTVLLGHPGAGKSKFTEMLAAQLPESDFLAIRVELRNVQPNSPIHVQIEDGLKGTLHDHTSWRGLAESADGALPVIILDGFDELLQATGVDRSDYLERVQEFQERQGSMGQPVAVVVTSRTVVADRTRFPLGTVAVRLAPFAGDQITHMLQVWNSTNGAELTRRGLEPLTTDILLRYRELAEQPLLLIMLLIYDSDRNALRQAAESLSHGQLYERLLTRFAEREVEKHHSSLTEDDLDEAVAQELRHLEVAALAMFSRRRQSVRAEELGSDLAVLMPEAFRSEHGTDLHGRISPADQLLGRFFFVHEARAQRSDGTASVFEFLHTTFGEYLVARTVVETLDDLVDEHAGGSRRRRRRKHSAQRIDDGELHAYASFASFAGRQKVMDFLGELLEERLGEEPEVRKEYTDLLMELFREAPFPAPNRSFSDYEPVRLPHTRREAAYTANLVIMLSMVTQKPVEIRELHPDSQRPLQSWQATAALWRTLPSGEWFSILSSLRVRHLFAGSTSDITSVVEREQGDPINAGECVGFYLYEHAGANPTMLDPYEISIPYASEGSHVLRSVAMRLNGTAARLFLDMLPYPHSVAPEVATRLTDRVDGQLWTRTHEVLRLRLPSASPGPEELASRLTAYRRLLHPSFLGRRELMVLRQAVEDLSLWEVGDAVHQDELRSLVSGFLENVRSLRHDVAHTPDLRTILSELAVHIGHRQTDRVLGLAHVRDRASETETSTSGTAAKTPRILPQHVPGPGLTGDPQYDDFRPGS